MKINRTKNKIASKISVYDRTVSYANVRIFGSEKKIGEASHFGHAESGEREFGYEGVSLSAADWAVQA
jgi:hypothetical protein